MNIQTRTASVDDSNSIRLLSAQLGYEISLADTEANIREVLTSKDHVAFVAVDNEKVIGWVHAFPTRTIESLPFVELAGLIVDENYRSKGIGKILVERIKEWCIEKNILHLRVRSNVKRKEAHEFYMNNGFTEIKEQKVFQMKL